MTDTASIVNALIAATSDTDDDVAHTALEALARYQSTIAADFLVATLQSKNLKMRDRAKSILVRQQNPAVIPLLLEDLNSPRGYIRLKAAELLSELSDQSCVPELLKCLQDEHSDIRRQAATALGNIADPNTFDQLFAALSVEAERSVSDALVGAIGKVGDMGHVQIVLEAIVAQQTAGQYTGTLKDYLENSATELLKKLGDVDGLLAALRHENAAIRLIAARVLGQLVLPD